MNFGKVADAAAGSVSLVAKSVIMVASSVSEVAITLAPETAVPLAIV